MPQVGSGYEDIISGWRYCATLQLRTPLYVLQQHGRLEPASPSGPPQLTKEMWHGIWVPDLGEQFAFLGVGATMASEIGPVPADGGDYLCFLKAVRTISEERGSIDGKESALRELLRKQGPGGTPYIKFCSADDLVDRVLPKVINLLPVPANVRAGLLRVGFDTLGKVSHASDDDLLAIKYLGSKHLGAIRACLDGVGVNLTSTRALNPAFLPYDPSD
jgi:hypothetical protein